MICHIEAGGKGKSRGILISGFPHQGKSYFLIFRYTRSTPRERAAPITTNPGYGKCRHAKNQEHYPQTPENQFWNILHLYHQMQCNLPDYYYYRMHFNRVLVSATGGKFSRMKKSAIKKPAAIFSVLAHIVCTFYSLI